MNKNIAHPGTVFVVMVTTGEYSDRSEWPHCATFDESEAEAKVEELSDRMSAARAIRGSSPSMMASDRTWERFGKREEAAQKTVADICAPGLNASFFMFAVSLLPSAIKAAGGEAP